MKRVDDEVGRKEQERKPVRMENLMLGCVKLSIHRGKVGPPSTTIHRKASGG